MFWKNYPSWIKYGLILAFLDFIWVTFWVVLSLFFIKGEDNLGVGIVLWTSQFFLPTIFLFFVVKAVGILKVTLSKDALMVILLLANYLGLVIYFFLGVALSKIINKKNKNVKY